MSGRDNKGRFVRGNDYASAGGKARAEGLEPARRKEIAGMGLQAIADRHCGGDLELAGEWLSALGSSAERRRPLAARQPVIEERGRP